MATNGDKWRQMGTNGDKWGPMGTNGDKWRQMATNGDKWGQMVTHRDKWGRMRQMVTKSDSHGDKFTNKSTMQLVLAGFDGKST